MTERVERLKRQSLEARPTLSPERALLVTEFYRDKTDPLQSPPVQRALAFREIMARKALYLGSDELIVGERGPEPKATPTFPELTCHSLEDLQILHARPKTSYRVPPEVLTRKKIGFDIPLGP